MATLYTVLDPMKETYKRNPRHTTAKIYHQLPEMKHKLGELNLLQHADKADCFVTDRDLSLRPSFSQGNQVRMLAFVNDGNLVD